MSISHRKILIENGQIVEYSQTL